jgi:glycosyltransferase involved in cell wall biosynthesis
MKSDIPLLFYANDSTRMFVDNGEEIVNKSSAVIIGINYVNRPLCDCRWLGNSNKLKAVVFQNREKLSEWERDEVGYEGLNKYVLFGAIELDKFLEVCPSERKDKEPLVVLRHSLDDYRKYVTTDSHGKGEKIHLWQKHFDKDKDTKFYARFLKDINNIRFEFMKGHKELKEFFKGDDRMVFHEWNAMPVTEFLARGHVWLYRTSNLWRDNYPRVHAEAMAAGLPTIVEPRDGTYERMCGGYGDRGFICVHYDGFKVALKTLQRKEKYRKEIGMETKEWSRKHLDPRRWVNLIEEVLDGI